jgi:ferredoxin-type protein NapH
MKMNWKPLQYLGLSIFVLTFLLFIATPFLGEYQITDEVISNVISDKTHRELLAPALLEISGETFTNQHQLVQAYQQRFDAVNDAFKADQAWDKVIYTDYTFQLVKQSSIGFAKDNANLLFWLIFILGPLGAITYILPQFKVLGPAGVKNNHIFHDSEKTRGWLGMLIGAFLISFYVMLYWKSSYITNWTLIVDQLSYKMNGGPASQWFLYGFMYTIAIVVMGIRMLIKYRNNNYQLIRTASVMFFQTAFAFTIPQILAKLNLPAPDFKNMWPLDYSFFFDYRLNEMIDAGTIGYFMLGWGIFLFVVGVPLFTYLYGKRWYCSWVCGCGGLAETLGDPFRQLSSKKLVSWQIERYLIHGVLVFAVVMTVAVLYTFFSGQAELFHIGNFYVSSYDVRGWYGFAIGATFSGVIGTGFYPLMGNRVWCRFGCPLAAYLGFVQRFKSRFRITTNGGQCISCGNCSTHCEMGIDVRSYAQKGQNIVRSSCVGCGVCASVCPRGVLKLENGEDTGQTRTETKAILLGNDGITLNL